MQLFVSHLLAFGLYMLILFIYFGLWRCHVPGNMNSYVFYTAWIFRFTFRIHICNLSGYGRLMRVMIPKMVTVACNLLSAVLKYLKLWKLTYFANPFSDNAWAVLIPGQCSLGSTSVNSHILLPGGCPRGPYWGWYVKCSVCTLTKMQSFLHPKPHLVPEALDKGL